MTDRTTGGLYTPPPGGEPARGGLAPQDDGSTPAGSTPAGSTPAESDVPAGSGTRAATGAPAASSAPAGSGAAGDSGAAGSARAAAGSGAAGIARPRHPWLSRAGRRPLLLAWLVVVVPALAELIVGGWRIGQASLWRDEAYTREVTQRPVGAIIALLRRQDAVHGLYYLGIHVVVIVLGTSATALRLPSLIATSIAAGLTALLGRQLCRAAAQPEAFATITGLLAGLLFVALPLTTWYAQDARPYAMATLFAVAATCFLVRGMTSGDRWCWAGYALAVAVLAGLNLAALLLLAAHGVGLLTMRARIPAGAAATRQLRTATRRWLIASAAAIVALSPLMVLAVFQSGQLNWVTRPDDKSLNSLVADFSGLKDLVPLVLALAIAGIGADITRRQRVTCVPAAITVPWLVLPPVVLLAASELKPVYVERYVVFCTPALALLTASGLVWLGRVAALTRPGRRFPVLAAVPSALLLAVMVAAVIAPQQAARRTAARTDDLRRVTQVLARHERPGDGIMYLPWDARVVGLAYPAAFERLRNIGQRRSPAASQTLVGDPVSPAVLAVRFGTVRRVWTVAWRQRPVLPSPLSREQRALLSGAHLLHRWVIRSVILTLYSVPAHPGVT
jgi:mannosyltransferase